MRWSVLVLSLSCLACGPKSLKARMAHSEKLADRIGRALDEAQQHQSALEPDRAERALADAKRQMEEPDLQLYPEASMITERYQELAARSAAVRQAREKRDLEERLNRLRESLLPFAQRMDEALHKLSPTAPTQWQINEVEAPAKHLRARVDAEHDDLAKSPDFAAWGKGVRARADKALERTALAAAQLAALDGPVRWLVEGKRLYAEAEGIADRRARIARLKWVDEHFLRRCVDGAASSITTLGNAQLDVEGKAKTIAQIAQACRDAEARLAGQVKALEKAQAKEELARAKPPAKSKAKRPAQKKRR